MVWCSICQVYHESHDEHEDSRPALLPALRFDVNAGAWDISDLALRPAAAHSPTFDALMVAFREAQRAVADDEARVRRLPRPWLGDPFHRQLKRQMDTARAAARAYLIAHQDLVFWS